MTCIMFRICDPAQHLVTAEYDLDHLHDLPNVRSTSTAVKYKRSLFNNRYDTLPRSTGYRYASEIALQDESVSNNFWHCLV